MAASMNNWLGFSLSPQDQQQMVDSQSSMVDNFNSDTISGTGECFDLGSNAGHSSLPSLNLPPPFGLLEPYHNHHDWNMKGSSDLSVLMSGGGSCNENTEIQPPKFENFLSVGNTGNYLYQLPPQAAAADVTATTHDTTRGNTATSSIGLSMIKNWLRNNPTPSNQNTTTGVPPEVQGTDERTGAMSVYSGGGRTNELSLSMGGGGESLSSDNKRQQMEVATTVDSESGGGAVEAVPRKSIDTFGQRTSIYRGVTRHRWTGRYEAHLWDNSCRREGQVRKGRQVYLGGYDKEDKAARAYDLTALKYWGTTTTTNFPISNYEKEIEDMKNMTRQEYVASLRRKSSGFSRGASIYRGVTRHHQHGRWQARIGRVAGNKDLYLGTFGTQEEAAEAYDIAAIKFRGLNAVTNFEINRYDVKCILESTTLPIGGAAKRLKDTEKAAATELLRAAKDDHLTTHLTHEGINNYATMTWPSSIDYHHHQAMAQAHTKPFSMHYPQHYNTSNQQRLWCKQEQQQQQQHEPDGQSFQDLQQLHQFFQPSPNSSVLHNLMSMDSSSMDHSYSSGGGGGDHSVMGYGGGGGGSGYMNHMIANSVDSSQDGDGNMYYHHQGSSYSGWVPTAIPTLAARTANLVVAHGGAPNFTTWNDS
ncbi:AP2-like ethylene-responsive transcription factor BBM [Bidens hawaiensis]|uniref:AP2-like ethylene-responsive transcription factor BBM n=1 Tax=Bidens hawaiensis TaxID=980011 RepID=UPI00404B2273